MASVIDDLKVHQKRLGDAPADAAADDPRERLRLAIGYRGTNSDRMDCARYRREGLPTPRVWMESAVKELNYRVKGTKMFWNNPAGAETILCIRAATLSDDDRLTRLLEEPPRPDNSQEKSQRRSGQLKTTMPDMHPMEG